MCFQKLQRKIVSILYLLLFTLLFLPQLLLAQSDREHPKGKCDCDLSFNVLDAKTQEVLPLANVWIEELDKGGVTNKEGAFKLENICACTCHLKISFVGYQDYFTTLDLEKEKGEVLNFYMTEDQKMLNDVVVEGEKAVSEIATLSTSSLDSELLERSKGENLGENLENISGVSTLKTGTGIAKPIIHGVHSNRVLILNNGIRMEAQQWGVEHAPEIDPFIAKDIAVIKGAGAVKYGSDAIGGVVVVNPPALPTNNNLAGELNLVGESNGQSLTGSGMLEGGIGNWKGWGWRVQGTIKRGGDQRTPDYILTNTGVQENNFSLGLGVKKLKYGFEAFYSHFNTEIGVLRATGLASNLDDLQLAFETDAPQGTEPFSYDIINPSQNVSHDLLKIKGHYFTGLGKINVQYGFQFNHREEFDVRFQSLSKIPSLNLEITTHTLDAELIHKAVGKLHGSIGLNALYQENRNVPGTQRSNFIPNFQSAAAGFYLIEHIDINRWVLEGGLRYDFKTTEINGWNQNIDRYSDQFEFHNVTATLGGVYTINSSSSFNTNLGFAWRPPNVAELYSFGKHQSAASFEYGLLWSLIPRPEVEEFDNIDIKNEQGLKWINTFNKQTDNTQLEVTAYANWILNYIYLRPEGVTTSINSTLPYLQYTQTDALFIGLDATVIQHISDNFKWENQLSFLHAKDIENNGNLPFIPTNQLKSSLEYKKSTLGSFSNFYTKLGLTFSSEPWNAPRIIPIDDVFEAAQQDENIFSEDNTAFDIFPIPDGYVLGDFEMGIQKKLSHSSINFRLNVQNIFNATYRSYTNRLRYFADELGRNMRVIVSYEFE